MNRPDVSWRRWAPREPAGLSPRPGEGRAPDEGPKVLRRYLEVARVRCFRLWGSVPSACAARTGRIRSGAKGIGIGPSYRARPDSAARTRRRRRAELGFREVLLGSESESASASSCADLASSPRTSTSSSKRPASTMLFDEASAARSSSQRSSLSPAALPAASSPTATVAPASRYRSRSTDGCGHAAVQRALREVRAGRSSCGRFAG